MDYSPAYIMAQYMIGNGILSDPTGSGDWPVYVSILPDGDTVDVAHDAVACIDTSPVKDGRYMSNGSNLFHHGCQFLLRASAYNTGFQKMEALKTELEGIARNTVTISGASFRLDSVTLTTGIVVLGQEESTKRRELFSLNFLITLKEI